LIVWLFFYCSWAGGVTARPQTDVSIMPVPGCACNRQGRKSSEASSDTAPEGG
jgi:hypothetical protein